jgi:ribonuclease HI
MYARYQLLKARLPILHVNGHVGLEGNELADRMSILAISEKQTEFRAYPDLSDIKALLALRAG